MVISYTTQELTNLNPEPYRNTSAPYRVGPSVNEVWKMYAYRLRLDAQLEDRRIPRRKELRDLLRLNPELHAVRRSIFGMWRFRPVRVPRER